MEARVKEQDRDCVYVRARDREGEREKVSSGEVCVVRCMLMFMVGATYLQRPGAVEWNDPLHPFIRCVV